jgi:protein-S-isoprenylcysteine O-methyltransferase Ste14
MESTIQRSEASVEEYFFVARQRLESLHTSHEVAALHWRYFRDRYGLTRQAAYPESTQLLLALVVLFILLEAVLNSFFFAESHPLGIIGAIGTAIFISAATVGSGFLVGRYVYPQNASPSAWARGRGIVGIGLWIALILALNLLVGHYRDLLDRRVDAHQALTRAPLETVRHPLELGTLSLVMLVIGLMLASAAFIDGAKWDDPFPGYGDVDRTLRATRKRLDEALEESQLAMSKRIRAASSEATGIRLKAERDVQHMGDLVGGLEPLEKSYQENLEAITDACRNLLTAYRSKNLQIRGARTGPDSFSEFPSYANEFSLGRATDLHERLAAARAQLQDINSWDADVLRREVERLHDGHERLRVYHGEIHRAAVQSPQVVQALKLGPGPS